MKALNIYPHAIDRGHDCIIDSEGTMRVHRELDDFASAKRFGDAELAAECWMFVMADFKYPDEPDDLTDEDWKALNAECREAEAALRRFATLPHFDEVAS